MNLMSYLVSIYKEVNDKFVPGKQKKKKPLVKSESGSPIASRCYSVPRLSNKYYKKQPPPIAIAFLLSLNSQIQQNGEPSMGGQGCPRQRLGL